MSLDVISPTTLDRLLDSFRKLVRAELPTFTFTGLWEYSVQATDGTTIDCSPTDTAIPLPSLAKVPMLSGLMGEISPAVVGKKCVIVFLNQDPTKARCISVDGATEHVMTTQAAALLMYNTLVTLSLALIALGAAPTATGAVLGATLQPLIVPAISAAITAQGAPAPRGLIPQQVAAALLIAGMTAGTAPSITSSPFNGVLAPILAAPKSPNVSGLFPGVGATK